MLMPFHATKNPCLALYQTFLIYYLKNLKRKLRIVIISKIEIKIVISSKIDLKIVIISRSKIRIVITSRAKIEIVICIPGRFSTSILHQLLDYKITFVNSQLENKNSKGDFVLKNRFEIFLVYVQK